MNLEPESLRVYLGIPYSRMGRVLLERLSLTLAVLVLAYALLAPLVPGLPASTTVPACLSCGDGSQIVPAVLPGAPATASEWAERAAYDAPPSTTRDAGLRTASLLFNHTSLFRTAPSGASYGAPKRCALLCTYRL